MCSLNFEPTNNSTIPKITLQEGQNMTQKMCAGYEMTFHVNFMLIHCFNLTMKNISLAMKYLGHNPEYTTVYIKALCLFIYHQNISLNWLFKLLSHNGIIRGQLIGWTGKWTWDPCISSQEFYHWTMMKINHGIKTPTKKQINKIEQFLLNTNQQTCSS